MGLIFVGLGGACGAMLRYGISLLPYRGSFPLLTLVTNLVGALAIGFLSGLCTRRRVSEHMLLFWKTGVCGGFTTFSTFSLEACTLLKAGSTGLGILYAILSVALCIAGVYIGMALGEARVC